MSAALEQTEIASASAPGTVEVTRAVGASATEVWQALTAPPLVAQWFGDLTAPLSAGQMTNLEFGDGDFFLLDVLRLDPPHTLQYTWRFFSIGPRATITWRITSLDEGSLVTVTDSEPERTPEEALLLRKGWLDFTNRLEIFLREGRPTRYPWRSDFAANIELPSPVETIWELLLEPTAQSQWFPLGGSVLEVGASFSIDDGIEPSVCQLLDVVLDVPGQIQFKLTDQHWLHPTCCQLDLRPRHHGTMLSVTHNGWLGISLDKDYQKQQRTRFSELWFNILCRFTLEYVRRQKIPAISPEELRARVGQPGFFVFDSNTISQWQLGHIPGATYVGTEYVGANAFAPELLPQDKNSTLAFYCSNSF